LEINGTLNPRSQRICDFLSQLEHELRITRHVLDSKAVVFDYGVNTEGGLRAGVHLAEICLAGLAEVKLVPGPFGQAVNVYTDHPVTACLGSQYAGWQVTGDPNKDDKFFAMGSGPMRAAFGNEAIIQEIGVKEKASQAVGVLECATLPNDDVCERVAADCHLPPGALTLCVAPTASYAGTVQVVARSVETALHKIHELGFDVKCIRSGFGNAPLPPVAANDLVGIGRTNDAVLYGGDVTLWVHAEDDELAELVDKIPSKASRDFGVPFGEIFKRYDGDFYKIDPHLFSPAKVTLVNLKTGRTFSSGEIREDLVRQSFYA
jgi:methenyltetrahydromethanopterin cyclohydrolase